MGKILEHPLRRQILRELRREREAPRCPRCGSVEVWEQLCSGLIDGVPNDRPHNCNDCQHSW